MRIKLWIVLVRLTEKTGWRWGWSFESCQSDCHSDMHRWWLEMNDKDVSDDWKRGTWNILTRGSFVHTDKPCRNRDVPNRCADLAKNNIKSKHLKEILIIIRWRLSLCSNWKTCAELLWSLLLFCIESIFPSSHKFSKIFVYKNFAKNCICSLQFFPHRN